MCENDASRSSFGKVIGNMLRKLTFVLAAAAALMAQTPAKKPSALDKATMEAYIRHLFVWPAEVQIAVDDPKPGPMDGFYQVKVTGMQGTATQSEAFFVSKDGQKILRGAVYDVNQNPFKETLDKLKTELQPSFGTPGASVVLVEFSDFQCPYCKVQAKMLRDNLLAAYPKDVRLYYLDYPLEPIHPWAKPAAIAGRCIFHQSASTFWDFHDWIFQNQEQITTDNMKDKIVAFATEKGIDAAQLSKCIDGRLTEDEVAKTVKEGRDLEVVSTPTLFVNGRRMVGAVQWTDLKRVIDFEIEYQKTAKNAGEDCGCTISLPIPGQSAPSSTLGISLK
jgi:protein-disulfide isomerase